eukprot:7391722-Pyramimonas_sp.AAC.1
MATGSGPLDVSSGVALLTRNVIPVTAPPFTPSHVLEEARVLAGHVHWGVKGGLIVVVVYLRHSVGMDDDNSDT